MILSNIVKLVNAKSFGETTYTYEEIYPYFLEAVNAINGDIDSHRHIPEPPPVSEYSESYGTLSYTALSDMHIANFIVTYIVVAMDNASLSVTSRTQTYASQLEAYKRKLISDLYRWMPITTSSNSYFDLTGDKPTLGIPNVGKVWYDENEGGKLSSNTSPSGMYNSLPTVGVHCENPYGSLVPKDPSQRIKEGTNYYDYIFYPFDYFRNKYTPVIVRVSITGYDIPFSIPVTANAVYDIGEFESLDDLIAIAWSLLKSDDGTSLENSPSLITGSVKNASYKSTHTFVPYESGIKYTNEFSGITYKITKQSDELVSEVIYNIHNKQDKLDDNTLDINIATLSAKKMTLQYYDSATDTTKTGQWVGNLVPADDRMYDLGSKSKSWQEVYAEEINADKLRVNGSLFAQYDNGIKIYNPMSRNIVLHENDGQLLLQSGGHTVFDSKPSHTKIISNEGAAVLEAGQSLNYNYIRLRTPDGSQVFNAHSNSGAIDIDNDNFNILANSKINLIPNYSGITTDVDPSMYNRIKIGGEEVVRNEDITGSKVTEVIMSYKEAYSGNGQLAKFAITCEGDMYYHGEEVATVGIVKAIEDVIPPQATADNKLADKDFVNSSISTATATFRGTYTSISDFPLNNADSNDYLFYDTTDELGNRKFDKYKYSNGEWKYEYTLNNSSFTSDQWKAINSGITKEQLNNILNNLDKTNGTIGNIDDLTTTNKSNIVESINEVNNKQNILQPQNPKGTYENLSALQTAYPNGASGVYLTTDNGHWYYWNGSAWTDGGVYQATEIADRSLGAEKVDFLELDFDLSVSNLVPNSYFGASNGKIISYSGGTHTIYRSELLDISKYAGCKIIVQTVLTSGSGICIYDANSRYIEGYNYQSGNKQLQSYYQNFEITLPNNSYYIGVSTYSSVDLSTNPTKIYVTGLPNVIEKILGINKDFLDISLNDYYTLDDTYVNYSNGSFASYHESPSLKASTYISVKGMQGCKLIVNTTLIAAAGIVFYDENKNYISGVKTDSAHSRIFTRYELDIPNNASYFAFSCYDPNTNTPSARFEGFLEWKDKRVLELSKEEYEKEQKFEITSNGGACRIFHSWGCIGDSLTSGEFEYTRQDSTTGYLDAFEYSYPQCMARTMGVNVVNYSSGGQTAKNIYETNKNNLFESNHPIYTIALGTNDSKLINENVYSGWGTENDIDLENYNNNANTFVGWYAKIIQRLQASNPDSVFFLITNPVNNNSFVLSSLNIISNKLNRCYVIDMTPYLSNWTQNYKMGAHLDAYGYQVFSDYLLTLINNVILENEDKFKQIGFYNTTYKNENYYK